MSVMVAGLLSYLLSFSESVSLSEVNRETVIAVQELRATLEEVRATDFDDVFATYNEADADDPGGAGTAVGADFAVPGFTPQDGDADGMVGKILFPTVDGQPDRLTETPTDDFPFLPRDLNLDGDAGDADVTADCRLLPVVVRLEWSGRTGDRQLEIAALLTEL